MMIKTNESLYKVLQDSFREISSVESQKGAINIQRCSVKNQGAIDVKSRWW